MKDVIRQRMTPHEYLNGLKGIYFTEILWLI